MKWIRGAVSVEYCYRRGRFGLAEGGTGKQWPMMRTAKSVPLGRTERTRTLVFLGMCLAIALAAAPIRPGVVLGESMAPTFHSGQVFLLFRLSPGAPVGRGDVVLFSFTGQTYLKRVYAVAGDELWGVAAPGEEGVLSWVMEPEEAQGAEELLRRYPNLGQLVHFRVPPEHVFVLGDAGANSYDSRYFGPLPIGALRARSDRAASLLSLEPRQPRARGGDGWREPHPVGRLRRGAGRPGGGGRPVRSAESHPHVVPVSPPQAAALQPQTTLGSAASGPLAMPAPATDRPASGCPQHFPPQPRLVTSTCASVMRTEGRARRG